MSDDAITKRMGQLLRKGAALLNIACPKCNTPLLRLQNGSVYCAKCNREVVEQKTARTDVQPSGDILNQLGSLVLTSLVSLIQSLPEKPHPEEIRSFAKTAKDLIEILKGIRELQS